MKRTEDFKNTRLSWCFALVWIFLIGQLIGIQHRVEHTRWQINAQISSAETQLSTPFTSPLFARLSSQSNAQQSLQVRSQHSSQLSTQLNPSKSTPLKIQTSALYNAGFIDAAHSCIALDAACLADALSTLIVSFSGPELLISNPVPALRTLWDALFVSHFRSRAPPVLL